MKIRNIFIAQSKAKEGDFERLGDKLSHYTKQRKAPDFDPVSKLFQAAVVRPKGQKLKNPIVGEAVVTQNWGRLEIDLLFVEEAFRRQGVGTALMKQIQQYARAEELMAIRLNTPSWQGVGFYETCGFSEMGRIPLDAVIKGERQYEVTYTQILAL